MVKCGCVKQRCSTNRCQCRKAGLACTELCACSDDEEPRENGLQEDDSDEYIDDNDESDNSYDKLCLYHTFKGRLITVLSL